MARMDSQLQSMLREVIQTFQAGNFDKANFILSGIIRDNIRNADNIFELGMAFAKAGRFNEALSVLYSLQPHEKGEAKISYNLGVIHSLMGEHALALTAYDLALEIQPNDVETLINKGSTCNDLKKYALSLEVLESAIKIRPDIPEAWSNKGIALNNLTLYQESLNAYNKAIEINPGYYEAWSNKSVPLNKLKRHVEALEACCKALSLKPDYAEAYSNKGVTLNELKRYDEAIEQYNKALSLKPEDDWIYGDLIFIRMKICSWLNLSESLEYVTKNVMASKKVAAPFPLLALSDNASLQKKSSEIYAEERYPCRSTLGPISRRVEKQKIRIGYFSADFRNHAVSFLTAELFELHDKDRFEIIAFSFGVDDKSPMRLRLSQAFNQFVDVSRMSDLEIAKLSRELLVDIAVDLGGYTAESRTGIFGYQAAPIQVSYIGYLGTMGTSYMNYLLADRVVVPEGSKHLYTEEIAYLPTYQVNDRKRIISDKSFTRKELGLPEKGFVFCCFNNNYKILPATFNSWMQILRVVEGSVLFLYAENKWAEVNLKKEAESRGIDSARLIFGTSLSRDEYLARYRMCDLFLDTFPYNAGTTASDALWTGLPVLTLIGQSFASRMAASLLSAIGLPELIANTPKEYEALAIELASNPKKIISIRQKLAENRLTTPLFDTPLFTINLEVAYVKMMERYWLGLPPEHHCV